MEEGKSYLKTRLWKKVKRAFEDLKEDTNNFTTKRKLDPMDIQAKRHMFIALRLANGWSREMAVTHIGSTAQSLEKWEEEKRRRTPLPYQIANALLLSSDFKSIRERNPNAFITTFFRQCSLSDMKKDLVARRNMNIALGFATIFVFASFVLQLFSDDLGIGVVYGFYGSLILFLSIASLSAITSPGNPLLRGSSVEEELIYASRFLLSRDSVTQKWARGLLNRAAKMIAFRGRELPEPEDMKKLYEGIADSVRLRLIPYIGNLKTLTKEQKTTFVSTIRRLAEYFLAPTMKSAISVQVMLQDLEQEIPQTPIGVRERRLITWFARGLGRVYQSSTGRLFVDGSIFLFVAFLLATAFRIYTDSDIQTAAIVFAAVFTGLVGLRAVHLRSR